MHCIFQIFKNNLFNLWGPKLQNLYDFNAKLHGNSGDAFENGGSLGNFCFVIIVVSTMRLFDDIFH